MEQRLYKAVGVLRGFSICTLAVGLKLIQKPYTVLVEYFQKQYLCKKFKLRADELLVIKNSYPDFP
ncbi:MAG: hypothetical protein R6X10_14230 [Desulfobacterales bacterium]